MTRSPLAGAMQGEIMKNQRGGTATVRQWLILLLIAAGAASATMNLYQMRYRTIEIQLPLPNDHSQLTLKLVPPEALQPTTFETMNEAAVKAMEYSYHVSHYYEVGGVITKLPNGKFAMGAPITDFSGDSIAEIDFDPLDYHGEIVASYHTHPCNSHTHVPSMFSPEDMHSDRSHHTVGYVANLCTGDVMRHDPSTDHPNPHNGWAGTVIGKIPVDGAVLDEHTAEIL
jgi:hypothetical protein